MSPTKLTLKEREAMSLDIGPAGRSGSKLDLGSFRRAVGQIEGEYQRLNYERWGDDAPRFRLVLMEVSS